MLLHAQALRSLGAGAPLKFQVSAMAHPRIWSDTALIACAVVIPTVAFSILTVLGRRFVITGAWVEYSAIAVSVGLGTGIPMARYVVDVDARDVLRRVGCRPGDLAGHLWSGICLQGVSGLPLRGVRDIGGEPKLRSPARPQELIRGGAARQLVENERPDFPEPS